MKLAPLFWFTITAAAALGCTKKPTPEFESAVRDWQQRQCDCYAVSDRCTTPEPEAELSAVEHLMANAGVLKDARSERLYDAESAVRSCARRAAQREQERTRAREIEKAELSAPKFPPPSMARSTASPKKAR